MRRLYHAVGPCGILPEVGGTDEAKLWRKLKRLHGVPKWHRFQLRQNGWDIKPTGWIAL